MKFQRIKIILSLMVVGLVLIFLTSCKKHYKLQVGKEFPPEIARSVISKEYTEGRNVMYEGKNWRLLIDIKNGKIDQLWYQPNTLVIGNSDSLIAIPKDNNPGGGGTTRDCFSDYSSCLRDCPVVPWTDPYGNPGTQYAPNCVAVCDKKWSECELNKGGLRRNIRVIRF
jgi:hypothetical protein